MELDIICVHGHLGAGESGADCWRTVLLGVCSSLPRMYAIVANDRAQRYMLAPERYKTVFSYVIGWLTSLAWIATVATETLFAGTIIQGIMILDDPNYPSKPWQGTLLTWAVIFGCVLINVVIPAWLPKLEVFILVFHITGFIAIVVTLVRICQALLRLFNHLTSNSGQ